MFISATNGPIFSVESHKIPGGKRRRTVRDPGNRVVNSDGQMSELEVPKATGGGRLRRTWGRAADAERHRIRAVTNPCDRDGAGIRYAVRRRRTPDDAG